MFKYVIVVLALIAAVLAVPKPQTFFYPGVSTYSSNYVQPAVYSSSGYVPSAYSSGYVAPAAASYSTYGAYPTAYSYL
ncbi:uncharacterized protein LOC129743759 [Uranotaenia lowii]|uniref:uncharacterized protein LOC129743759 n=1 Tax=Uranotaenia lowii TaxID=190385 RepID=UPI00247851A6|nr:uncharacterized protein LOC129743759 [Uranotaenia lowii]